MTFRTVSGAVSEGCTQVSPSNSEEAGGPAKLDLTDLILSCGSRAKNLDIYLLMLIIPKLSIGHLKLSLNVACHQL